MIQIRINVDSAKRENFSKSHPADFTAYKNISMNSAKNHQLEKCKNPYFFEKNLLFAYLHMAKTDKYWEFRPKIGQFLFQKYNDGSIVFHEFASK